MGLDGIRRILPSDLRFMLDRELDDCCSIIDLGCGPSSPLRYVSKKSHTVGVEIFRPYIRESKRQGIHDEYVLADLADIKARFEPRSFDCVLALEVIEHFDKGEGLKLIGDMVGLASKKIIISTPNGFYPQGECDGNIRQTHKSGWDVEEMVKRGYRVSGFNGWKPLRGKPIVSSLTQPLVESRPECAFQLFCVKDLRGR
jgi:hypothetical protein